MPPDKGNEVWCEMSMELANELLETFRADGEFTLRYWRQEFWEWIRGAYVRLSKDDLEKTTLFWLANNHEKDASPRVARDIVACLASSVIILGQVEQPDWQGNGGPRDPADWVAMENGILDIRKVLACKRNVLRKPSPLWFSPTVLPFRYDPNADCPQWRAFLEDVFEGDQDRIALLQEWFGYCLTCDTSLQAILLLVGPRRSGKGTVQRILTQVVGSNNVIAPQLSNLGSDYGLWSFVGKSVAIFPDAHLPRGNRSAQVVGLLKSISGEDSVEINRKYLIPITCQLKTRIVIACNIIPDLADASLALASRLKILPFHVSYEGREDRKLETKLSRELQGILNWSLKGLKRLRSNVEFTDSSLGTASLDEYKILTAPEKVFLDECCEVGPGRTIECWKLWRAWESWCEQNGHPAGARANFGAVLRGLIPKLDTYRPSQKTGNRPRFYKGIGLFADHKQVDRSARSTGLSSSANGNKSKNKIRNPADRVDRADGKAASSIPADVAAIFKDIPVDGGPGEPASPHRKKVSAKRKKKKGRKGEKARRNEASSS